jgi:DNA-binding cell septation regulator SpoVG
VEKQLKITDIAFKAAGDALVEQTGLLGWISVTIDNRLRLDGVTLRRTADGRLTLSFPAKRDGTGRKHSYVRPIDDRTRIEIEQQVFHALGLEEEPAR